MKAPSLKSRIFTRKVENSEGEAPPEGQAAAAGAGAGRFALDEGLVVALCSDEASFFASAVSAFASLSKQAAARDAVSARAATFPSGNPQR